MHTHAPRSNNSIDISFLFLFFTFFNIFLYFIWIDAVHLKGRNTREHSRTTEEEEMREEFPSSSLLWKRFIRLYFSFSLLLLALERRVWQGLWCLFVCWCVCIGIRTWSLIFFISCLLSNDEGYCCKGQRRGQAKSGGPGPGRILSVLLWSNEYQVGGRFNKKTFYCCCCNKRRPGGGGGDNNFRIIKIRLHNIFTAADADDDGDKENKRKETALSLSCRCCFLGAYLLVTLYIREHWLDISLVIVACHRWRTALGRSVGVNWNLQALGKNIFSFAAQSIRSMHHVLSVLRERESVHQTDQTVNKKCSSQSIQLLFTVCIR